MNLIVNAVASIVDAHTHYLDAAGQPDYRERVRHSRSIRAHSVLASLGALRSWLGNAVDNYRSRAEEKRELNHLLSLNDHLLEDIGLSRGDLLAAKYGAISLAELQDSNRAKSGSAAKLHSRKLGSRVIRAKAANESVFGVPECA